MSRNGRAILTQLESISWKGGVQRLQFRHSACLDGEMQSMLVMFC